MRILVIGIVALIAAEVHAEGFGARDLTAVAPAVREALGTGFSHRSEPQRVTLFCPQCDDQPSVDLQIGRQTDGTEERVRSGQTPISRLEELCQEKSSSCRVIGLDVAPAVGWISTYPMGSRFGSTIVILRDGDLLTIRSLASKAEAARNNAEKALRAARPKLIGN